MHVRDAEPRLYRLLDLPWIACSIATLFIYTFSDWSIYSSFELYSNISIRYAINLANAGVDQGIALRTGEFIAANYTISVGLFISRMLVELIWRETVYAGSKAIYILIAAFILLLLSLFTLKFADSNSPYSISIHRPLLIGILEFSWLSLAAAICGSRCFAQILASNR